MTHWKTKHKKIKMISNTMFCLNVVANPSTSFTIAFTYFISEIVWGKKSLNIYYELTFNINFWFFFIFSVQRSVDSNLALYYVLSNVRFTVSFSRSFVWRPLLSVGFLFCNNNRPNIFNVVRQLIQKMEF